MSHWPTWDSVPFLGMSSTLDLRRLLAIPPAIQPAGTPHLPCIMYPVAPRRASLWHATEAQGDSADEIVGAMIPRLRRLGVQAMVAGDPSARWIMQAWLFFNEGFFWKPPQIQALPRPPTFPPHTNAHRS